MIKEDRKRDREDGISNNIKNDHHHVIILKS